MARRRSAERRRPEEWWEAWPRARTGAGTQTLAGRPINPRIGGSPATWLVPASGGITFTFTNPNDAPLSLALIDPGGDQWCVRPVKSGVEIPWSSLTRNCWASGGAALAPGQAIQEVEFSVYGGNTTATAFNICIENIAMQEGGADAGTDAGAAVDGGGSDAGAAVDGGGSDAGAAADGGGSDAGAAMMEVGTMRGMGATADDSAGGLPGTP